MTATLDTRIDPYLGTVVHIVQSRQKRPNLPDGCPFCVGGLEAPEPYDVRHFPNRWPALGEGRCEVILYSPDHDGCFASLGLARARQVVDLWAERTEALYNVEGVQFVLVFENRGAEVGATVAHPHGQIYAYNHVPTRPRRRFASEWRPDETSEGRCVSRRHGWTVTAQHASVFPLSLSIAPERRIANLLAADDHVRDGLAATLVDVLGRLDRLHGQPMPYMMWLNQAPPSAQFPMPWMDVEIVSPWRSAGVSRFIAAAEVACEEYFNPVSPEHVAEVLSALDPVRV